MATIMIANVGHVTSGANRGALGFRKAERLLEKVSAQSIGGEFVLWILGT